MTGGQKDCGRKYFLLLVPLVALFIPSFGAKVSHLNYAVWLTITGL